MVMIADWFKGGVDHCRSVCVIDRDYLGNTRGRPAAAFFLGGGPAFLPGARGGGGRPAFLPGARGGGSKRLRNL